MLYNHITSCSNLRLLHLGKYESVSFKVSCFQGYPSYTFNFDGERPRIKLAEIKFAKENTKELIADTAIYDLLKIFGQILKSKWKVKPVTHFPSSQGYCMKYLNLVNIKDHLPHFNAFNLQMLLLCFSMTIYCCTIFGTMF